METPFFWVSFKWVLNLSLSTIWIYFREMVEVSKTPISQHGKKSISLDVIRFKTYLREIFLKRFFLKQPSYIMFYKIDKNLGFLNLKLHFLKRKPMKPFSLNQSFSHVSIRISKPFSKQIVASFALIFFTNDFQT